MRITGVRSLPLFTPAGNFFFVIVETDEGVSGIGEAARMQWMRSIQEAVTHLEGWIVGHDPLQIETLYQLMTRGCYPPLAKIVYAAISAIDMALWDIKGKAVGMPVHKLLGGPVRDRLACYRKSSGSTADETLEDCRRKVAEGYRFVRIGAGDSSPPGIWDPSSAVVTTTKLVEQIREVVGADVEICVDVHTKMDTSLVIRLARALEPFRIFFLEDPIRSENPASYRTLARHVATPLAAGEQWVSRWQFREVIEEELIRYARVDLGIAGGISEAVKIAHACETHYIDLVPHNPNGPVGLAASAHVCFAVPNAAAHEIVVMPGEDLTDIFPDQQEVIHGHLLPPERPGLGIELDERAAARYMEGESRRPPAILRRPDGALNNG